MTATVTTAATYETDLAAARPLIERFIDPDQGAGNGDNWINDALNDSWVEGITCAEWVARAVVAIPSGFRRSAE